MIERYSRAEMRERFTDQARFNAWLAVEIMATQAFSELGVVPVEDYEKIKANATFDSARIAEIEAQTRHDVVAFTRALSETLGDEKRWIHYGLTSTDVVDTAYGYMYKGANDLLLDGMNALVQTLKEKAIAYENTACIGRTHGVHADITSFGLKFALWYDEMQRNLKRFEIARRDVEAGKISGAVGNFANTAPFVQDFVCEQLGLVSTNISTQVLQRDRHAHYMSVLALIASSLEKMALEIRHLQRTEVHEAEEFFSMGQKGSSAMPHKRNPIGSENITGCARVIRGYMVSAYENIPLWHERDISHSSAERIIMPDAIMLLDYMLHRFNRILEGLIVYPEHMIQNIYKTNGVIFAQRVMTSLIEHGALSREAAYDLVQPASMKAYNENKPFQDVLETSTDVLHYLSSEQLTACFTLDYYLKEVNTIYRRVGIYES